MLDNYMVDKMFAELTRQYMAKAGTDPVSVARKCVEFLKAVEGNTPRGHIAQSDGRRRWAKSMQYRPVRGYKFDHAAGARHRVSDDCCGVVADLVEQQHVARNTRFARQHIPA